MDDPNSFAKEAIPNEDTDDPNKHLYQFTENQHFADIPHTDKLLEDSDSDESTSIVDLSNGFKVGYSESPRTKLSQFIPTSPFKINGNLCDSRVFVNPLRSGSRSFHVSLSMADEEEQTAEVIFSKSCDCAEEMIQSMQNAPSMIRSVSEDILQTPSAELSRRISVVSSSKGKLMAVTRIRPGEKVVRTPSITSQPRCKSPTRPAGDEPELPKKVKFTSEQKWIAFCLCLVDFTAFLSMSIIAPFFPREAAAKGMREAVSGFVFSTYALVMVISSPIFGKIIPTVGAKFVFLSGVGVCGSCNILFGLLDKVYGTIEFTVLCFVVRFFEALGAAALSTASCTILIDQFPDNIGTVFGLVETCSGVSMSIGPAIGGALYAVGGFGLPFFVLGGSVVLIIPFCWYLLRNVKDPEDVLTPSVSYKKLLSIPHVVIVCLILVVASQVEGFLDPTLEPLMRQYNLDASIIGLLFFLLAAAYSISSPIVGWVSGKVELRAKYSCIDFTRILLCSCLYSYF